MHRQLIAALVLGSSVVAAVGSRSQQPVRDALGASRQDPYEIAVLCTPYPTNIGRRVTVSSGEELQRALDAAVSGDTILLTAGATFRPVAPEKSFVLRNRPIEPGQWVIVRSASPAFDVGGSIGPNTRVDPTAAALMPKIRATATNVPAIRTAAGAHGYRLVGLDVGAEASVNHLVNLVEFGSTTDRSIEAQPSDIVLDRSYLHGNDAGDYRRGISANGRRLAVIESHLENFHDANTDSQAIFGANGPGPFKIVNNYLEAAGENIMFGGADPAIPQMVPSDIEIRRNLSTKRLSWRTARIAVKNAFELKNARRVLVDGNTFEHVWVSGQDGSAILLKSANQDGACPWCVTEYVTFQNNIVRGAANGVVINAAETGRAGQPLPIAVNHIRFENVLFEDLGGQWGGGGNLLRVFGGVADVSFTHITSRSNSNSILASAGESDVNPRLIFKSNIVERKWYGIGTGGAEGTTTLSRNFPGYTYRDNVLVNTSRSTEQAIGDAQLAKRYPSQTWVVGDWDSVGFVRGTSRLAANSRYARAADDGRDVGADLAAIEAAHAGPGGSSCDRSASRR